jgi:hypothetical protein
VVEEADKSLAHRSEAVKCNRCGKPVAGTGHCRTESGGQVSAVHDDCLLAEPDSQDDALEGLNDLVDSPHSEAAAVYDESAQPDTGEDEALAVLDFLLRSSGAEHQTLRNCDEILRPLLRQRVQDRRAESIVCLLEQTVEMNGEAFWHALNQLPVSKFVGPLRRAIARSEGGEG